jgi:hypothetical protein
MKLLAALLAVALAATLALLAFVVIQTRRTDHRLVRLDRRLVRVEHRVVETKDAACLAYEFASQPAVSHADELPVCREGNYTGSAFDVGRVWRGEFGYDRRTGDPRH